MMRVFKDGVTPDVVADGVPWCTERCPKHDGKRCLLLARKPDAICEPAVRQMQDFINSVEWSE